MTKKNENAVWKFEKDEYTANALSQMQEDHLLALHNRLAKYLGNEERVAFPSRKLLEGAVTGQLITANVKGTDKAPIGKKPAPTKGKPTKSAKAEDTETDMKTNAKKATSKKADSDRRKPKVTKERAARANFDGKKLNATVKENPRREGTSRHKSMGIVMSNKGITYENYLKKGGDAGDLAANVRKGYVKVS